MPIMETSRVIIICSYSDMTPIKSAHAGGIYGSYETSRVMPAFLTYSSAALFNMRDSKSKHIKKAQKEIREELRSKHGIQLA